MSAFEFAFSLFGLVLGLAMASVLAGFVRVLKARSAAPEVTVRIRVGWLTPAIGVVVVLDLISTWLLAWSAMRDVPITFGTLIAGTVVTAVYYVAANLVWPDDLTHWPDLDDWFDRHKAQIGGAIAGANIGFSAVDIATDPAGGIPLIQVAYIALVASLIVTRRRWQSGLVLAVMLGMLAGYALGVW
ncbi:MAG: hypothetical protein ACTHKM_03075 [Tsuneonella sp.]